MYNFLLEESITNDILDVLDKFITALFLVEEVQDMVFEIEQIKLTGQMAFQLDFI